jgi:hypothetical protein
VSVLAMERQGGEDAHPFFVRNFHCVMPVRGSRQGPGWIGGHGTYCKSDIERLCKGIKPGGGRLIQCLKTHKEEMSVGCAQALQKLKAKKQ